MKTNQPSADKPQYLKTRVPYVRRRSTNGALYVWFKYKGQSLKASLETDNEAIARVKSDKEISDFKARVDGGAFKTIGGKNPTLGELLKHFVDVNHKRVGLLTKDRLAPKSFVSIDTGVKKIQKDKPEWLGRDATKFKVDDFKEYADEVGRGNSPTTYNRVVDSLRNTYRMANDQNLIAYDPTAKLKRASAHASKAEVVLTDKEYDRLIEWITNSRQSHKYLVLDVVAFLRYFGTRINEARNVLKSDVELDSDWETNGKAVVGSVWIRKEHSKRAKKNRGLPILREAAPLIVRMLARQPIKIYGKTVREGYLLPIGKCYGILNLAYKELKFDPAIKGHHHFRHLAATKWIECGVNIKVVSELLLGHKDGGKLALGTYSHVRTAAIDAEVQKVTWNAPVAATAEKIELGGKFYTVAELTAMVKEQTPANVVTLNQKAA